MSRGSKQAKQKKTSSHNMNQEYAQQQLAAQLAARTKLIANDVRPQETVLDAGDMNELSLNTRSNLAAGEALLFVTNQRLILHRSQRSESWDYRDIEGFKDKRAPFGVPQRSYFRQLTVKFSDGSSRTIIGGRMFMSSVVAALNQWV